MRFAYTPLVVWWVLGDVCNVLSISSVSNVVDRLDRDDIDLADVIDSIGRLQKTTIVNESGLYDVIIRSEKPEAKKFKRWITHEVLPSIRKHGAYMTPPTIEKMLENPDILIDLCMTLKAEREKSKALAENLEEKTAQLDESKDWYTIKRVAALNGIDWHEISWKVLKDASLFMECDVKKIFDANYGEVNAYHIDVWRREYPYLMFDRTPMMDDLDRRNER